jgi:YhcH/YjgK/YiaL family protein
MIMDTLARGAAYAALHPAFAKAFAFLRDTDLAALPDGRIELDGDRLYVLVMTLDGRGQAGAKLEAHRRYIDIQAVIRGEDVMGWSPLAACRQALPFDASGDAGLFGDVPASWVVVPQGSFAVFFPEDAHAPLAGTGNVKKAVVKVAI